MSSVYADILGRTDGLERIFVPGEKPRTYGDLQRAAGVIATALTKAGAGSGTRVAICLDQSFEYTAALLGVRQAGGVAVLLAPDWTDPEKERVLVHAEARFAIADVTALCDVEPVSYESLGDPNVIVQAYDTEETESAAPDDAVLIYTSGTTGLPKGVLLTETGLSANVRAVASYLDLGPEDGMPVFTPPCYAYSLSQNLTAAWSGGKLLPMPSGLMFPFEVLQAAATHRLTGIAATPTAFRMLCDQDAGSLDLSRVRYAMTGGQFLNTPLVEIMTSVFPKATVVNMYGCSENSPRISYHHVRGSFGIDERGYFPVGRPVDGTEIQIQDAGEPVVPGGAGEVAIRGTSLMRRYWRDPRATDERIVNGWFLTRDLGYLDRDRLLHLTGRLSSVINIGNEKVSPEEVEKVLCDLPGVREAAVYGAKDPMLGESVEALVVLDKGTSVGVVELQRHCRRRISGYKVPRRIEIVDEIPRTHYGKIDRKRLGRNVLKS